MSKRESLRCHYDVFDLDRAASSEEIKKKYRILALRYHPDRNHGNEEEAAEKFKEVNAAYGVLNDPQERKWYDDHRDSILRGGDGTDCDGDSAVPNLWPYFNRSCFSDFDSSTLGFFEVYSEIFEKIQTFEGREGQPFDAPPFGNIDTVDSAVIFFYSEWSNFVSRASFAWEDKYNPNDAPNRTVKRAIEKENKKSRDAARKVFTGVVRNLVSHVRKRDPRMERINRQNDMKKKMEIEKRENAKKQDMEKKTIAREMKAQQVENDEESIARLKDERARSYLLADHDSDDSDECKNEVLLGDDDDDDCPMDNVMFCCELCNKDFKSAGHLDQHISSKVHKKKMQEADKLKKKAGSQKKTRTDTKGICEDTPECLNPVSAPQEVVKDTAVEDDGTEDDDGDDDDCGCELCDIDFKSAAQLQQHLSSKTHKKKMQEADKLLKKKAASQKKGRAADSGNGDHTLEGISQTFSDQAVIDDTIESD